MAAQTLRRTDAALASELRIAVMRLRRRLAAERAPENDLSLAAMAVLGLLFRADGQSVGDLARAERVQPPSMTRTVTALEAEGLVRRCPHATDGRQVLVELTAAGRARVLADRRERDAWLTRRLGELTPDERRLLAAVTPVLDRLAQAD
jgi:DNA-binding MarR family transcriptional regulator